MNPEFVLQIIDVGDVVRITTKQAVGVIGRVTSIHISKDGIVLEEVKDPDLQDQIDNQMTYDKALFPISEIKYIFVLDLTKKPTEEHGTNDSQSKI
ncbi:hypothetical protein LCGC14_2105810 [marine sediment metagenome]|uniref:KOW domain-containing protein n=1 Tax=marine sediment metagenome TaxID=412755 RepID=A0A0F9EVV7_9ZZZZ